MSLIYSGNGFDISKENNKYQILWEQGIYGKIVSYEITEEMAQKAMLSDEDAYEVKIYASSGHWPPSKEKRIEQEREFIRKFPKLLLNNPENQKLFNKDELKLLLKNIDEKKNDMH